MILTLALFTFLHGLPAEAAPSLQQRYEEGRRQAENQVDHAREPLDADYVARQRMRGFQMLIDQLVSELASKGFYVDRPRLLGAAIVPTQSLEVVVHSRPPNGRGQIIQHVDVFFVRNEELCRTTGWVTTLTSLSTYRWERLIERSTYPQVIIRPDECVKVGKRP